MFNFFKGLDYWTEAKRLQIEVERLEKENCELRKVIDEMKVDFANQNKKKREEAASCDFEVDFEGAGIVSIERLINEKGVEETMFGRAVPDQKEIDFRFVFYCSRERHNQIVEKFRKYKESRKAA